MNNKETKIHAMVYSRICGFFSPVNCWNPAKKEEFRERNCSRFKKKSRRFYHAERNDK